MTKLAVKLFSAKLDLGGDDVPNAADNNGTAPTPTRPTATRRTLTVRREAVVSAGGKQPTLPGTRLAS